MGRPAPRYLPALDGLRAVSVAAVVAFHLGRLRGGFLGVDVFFVISGFLITRSLLVERRATGRVALGAFWIRRFRRLVPALLVVLVVTVLASRWWLEPWRIVDIRNDALAALAYVANWRFVASGQSYFTSGIGPSPLRHTWSLAIEEQFYVVWPVLVAGLAMLATKRRRPVREVVGLVAWVLVVGSAGWMAVAAGTLDLTRVYYGTATRAFALGLGAVLACWWNGFGASASTNRSVRRRQAHLLAWAGAAALIPLGVLAATTSEDAQASYRGLFQAAALLAAVAVRGLAEGHGPVGRVLASEPLAWVGRRSYGIYLWSWPTQVLLAQRFGLDGWRLDATVVTVSLAAAAASFALIEEPIRTGTPIPWPWRGGARDGDGAAAEVPRPVGAHGLGVASLSIGAVVVVLAASAVAAPAKPGLLTVSDDQVRAVALDPSSNFTSRPDDATPSTSAPAVVTPTVPAASTTTSTLPPGPFAAAVQPVVRNPAADPQAVFGRPLRIMVTGDSVGWSLAWAASAGGLIPSIEISNRALVGCGILPADAVRLYRDGPPEPYAALCQDTVEAQVLGLAEQPDVVLLWVGAWEVMDHRLGKTDLRVGSRSYARVVERALQERLDLFRAAGVPTVIPLVTCFDASPRYTERLDRGRIDWVNARIRAVISRNRGWVRAIDPGPVLCGPDGQARRTNEAGVVMRADGAHFEADAATWFWNTWLAGAVASTFGKVD